MLHGGVNDLREMLRDHGQRWPFANIPLAMLSAQAGNVQLAQQALRKAEHSAGLEIKWRRLATTFQQNLQNLIQTRKILHENR